MADETNGNQDKSGQTDQGDRDAPQYVTETQLNKAISARFSAFEKKLEGRATEDRKATIGEVGSLLDEKLAGLTKPPGGDGKSTDQGDGSGGKSDDPRLRGMEKQIAKLTKQLEEEREARSAETRKAADASLRGKLAEALSGHGIEGKRASHAIGHLVDASKRVRYGDDGETLVFRDDDGQDVDLKTGLVDWAKSDDGKLYLAPSGASGSGAKRVKGAPPGDGAGDRVDEIGVALARELGVGG